VKGYFKKARRIDSLKYSSSDFDTTSAESTN